MALRLIRESSDAPNITNKDDVRMSRYAYGSNGVIRNFGQELSHSIDGSTFKINSGLIVLDGWEVVVDEAGWSIDFSSLSGGPVYRYTIYLEIDASTEIASIKYLYYIGDYPAIDKGDDLTQIPNGTARLVLFNVSVVSRYISEVLPRVPLIAYSKDYTDTINLNLINSLKSGSVIPYNSDRVGGMKIERDGSSVKLANEVFVRKRLVWRGEEVIPTVNATEDNPAPGLDVGVEFSTRYELVFKLNSTSSNPEKVTYPNRLYVRPLDADHICLSTPCFLREVREPFHRSLIPNSFIQIMRWSETKIRTIETQLVYFSMFDVQGGYIEPIPMEAVLTEIYEIYED